MMSFKWLQIKEDINNECVYEGDKYSFAFGVKKVSALYGVLDYIAVDFIRKTTRNILGSGEDTSAAGEQTKCFSQLHKFHWHRVGSFACKVQRDSGAGNL